MKANISPRVAVLLSISTATFTLGLTIKLNSALERWKSAIPVLWALSALLLVWAIYLAFFQTTDEERQAQRQQKKASLRRTMRDLKREYRKAHHVAALNFVLGPEYYIARTTAIDAALIHELIEEEGEPE